MVTSLDIFLLFTSAAVVILTAVLVPTLLQVKRAYKEAAKAIDRLEQELVPMSRKITAGAAEVEILAATCSAKLEETDTAIRTVRQAGETLLLTSHALKESVRPIISSVGGLNAGLRMFGRVFWRNKRG